MIDITKLSLTDVKKLIDSGEVSPLAVTVEIFKRIKKDQTNSFISTTEELAFQMAESITRNGPKNYSVGGVPIAVKDIFCTNQTRTTSGSKMLANFIPNYESAVTKRLWNSGGILVGKTNMDEFAMGSSTQHSYFGPCKNPWNLECVPGGSSGGSAASVASYQCYAALGSDTGGSVRQPASFCGVVGFKPSYGRCSRFGMTAYSSSLDQAGVLTRSVSDACLILDLINGQCDKDMTTSSEPWVRLETVEPDPKVTIGYLVEDMDLVESGVADIWRSTLEQLKTSGARVVALKYKDIDPDIRIEEKLSDKWLATYYALTPVEAFSNLSRYDGIRYGTHVDAENIEAYYKLTRGQFGDEVKRRIILGAHILLNETEKHYYKNALNYRSQTMDAFDKVFSNLDVIISPTSPHTAFKINEKIAPEKAYLEDLFTIPANLIRAPAISIPAGLLNGMPVGIQLFAKRFNEKAIIQVAKYLESIFDFKGLEA